MLAGLKEILQIARERNCAVGAFNTPTLESLTAVLSAAEELSQPVIISHAELHEPISPLADIGPVMLVMAKKARVPVCVHLDHGESLEYIKQAIELGFTGVMYDGSLLAYQENVENTKIAVAMAKEREVGVEAELGVLGGREAGGAAANPESLYTDPLLAQKFVEETGIDALAASFGTAHGIYKQKPLLDFDRIEKIRDLVNIPLVMHGGSGCSDEDYRKAIKCGIRKINYYSYMAREGVFAARALLEREDVTFYHDIAFAATKAMKEDAKRAISVFKGHE
jgi:fructose-bisphosphate aldolase class II